MDDLDKETVDFVPNYDEEHEEPVVLPAAFPNLLVNGGTGIAVGMATNMAPHNLGEVVDAICAQIDQPDITIPQLMKHIKGPDFPTGCMVCGLEGIRQYFATGRGSVKIRGRVGRRATQGRTANKSSSPRSLTTSTARELVERIADAGQRRRTQGVQGHHRRARRVRRKHPGRHRTQTRRRRQGRHQQPLQAHRARNQLRRQRPRHRPRTPQDAQPQGVDQLLHRASARGHPATNPLPAPQGRGPRRDPRRLPRRPRQPRRVHPHHPRPRKPATRPKSSCSPSSGPASRSKAGASASARKRA